MSPMGRPEGESGPKRVSAEGSPVRDRAMHGMRIDRIDHLVLTVRTIESSCAFDAS